jgi:ABC-type nitrate/sulfonate/bicarbonate transport system permease component
MTVTAETAPRRSWKLSERGRYRILGIASPVGLLLFWELFARLQLIDTRFFPAPSAILNFGYGMLISGELISNTLITLQRMFWGTLIGGVPALVLGVIMGLNRAVRALIDPLVAAIYPIPKSAILPLALLIFGLGEGSKVFMVALGVFFPVLINAAAGVLEINKIYLDVGHNFKASRWQMFRTIAVPGALPVIMTGFKLGIGIGLIMVTMAEMLGGADKGLGFMIWNAWQIFSVEQMYVGLFTIALIGFLMTILLDEIEVFLVPWKKA